MKKIILILAGALCLSTAAVQAQDVPQDTTRQSEQSQNYRKDMVKIQAAEIPTSLRTTLQDAQYQGWEKATIFRSKSNDMYLVEMKDADGKTKVHKFDANGKAVRDN